jgi:hypothetical protein
MIIRAQRAPFSAQNRGKVFYFRGFARCAKITFARSAPK